MKRSRTYNTAFLFVCAILSSTSCKKDDDGEMEITPDPQVVLPPDYVVLKSLYDTNSGNALGWDFDDTTMKSWAGVSLQGERVVELDISSKGLTTLADKIGELSELTSFTANDNNIVTIPSAIREWTKLTYFSINENAITNIPKEIGELQNLVELHVMGNQNTANGITKTVVTLNNGNQREYIGYIPFTYDETKEFPLLFQLHGSSGDGQKYYTISGWNELAEQHNLIAVYPTSYSYDLKLNGCGNDLVTKWNNYNLPKEVCPNEILQDDTSFFNQIIDELVKEYSIDTSRIYMAGFSNGSGMTSRLAVELSDRITVIGGLAGFFPEDTVYVPKRILPLHLMLGATDEKITSRTIFGDTIPST
ncbi:MAG: hypothetical protein ABJN84_12750 [Flavobacteriaceae bacterium]